MDQKFIKNAKKGAKILAGITGASLATGLVTSAIVDWDLINAAASNPFNANAYSEFANQLSRGFSGFDSTLKPGITAASRYVRDMGNVNIDSLNSVGLGVGLEPASTVTKAGQAVTDAGSDILSSIVDFLRRFFGGLASLIVAGVKYVGRAFKTVFTDIGNTTWGQGATVAIISALIAACAYYCYKLIKRRRKIKENFIKQYRSTAFSELKMPKMPKMPSIKGKNKDFLMKAAKGAKIAASVTAGGIAAGLVTSAIVDWDLIEKASFFSMKNNTSALNEFANELASAESFGTKVQRAASKVGLAESPDTFISKVTTFFRTWFGGVVTQLVNAVKYVFNAFKTVFTNIKGTTLGQGVTVAVVCAFLAACVYWIYRIIKRKRKIKESYIRFI